MIREDLSEKLIHLTRDYSEQSGKDRFFSILRDKSINGTSSGIDQNCKYICFSEAPISAVGRIIATRKEDIRYKPYGFMFSKEYLFQLGARPVIYQTDNEYKFLPEKLKYKHVSYDLSQPNKPDWTWEREWRLKTDELKLDNKNTTLILPNRMALEEVISNYQRNMRVISSKIFGSFPQVPWHFIVLEDLGFSFKDI